MALTITIRDLGGITGLRAFANRIENAGPLMRQIGAILVKNTHIRFRRAQAPDGSGWAALNPAYAASKRGPGILRERGMRGGLMGSIHADTGDDYALVSPDGRVYAAIHQFGGKITPKNANRLVFQLGNRLAFARSVTIPARPYLGISAEDERDIREAAMVFLRRAAR